MLSSQIQLTLYSLYRQMAKNISKANLERASIAMAQRVFSDFRFRKKHLMQDVCVTNNSNEKTKQSISIFLRLSSDKIILLS